MAANKKPYERARYKNNKTGYTGVFWRESRRKFIVNVGYEYIGVYPVLEEAIAAREQALRQRGIRND